MAKSNDLMCFEDKLLYSTVIETMALRIMALEDDLELERFRVQDLKEQAEQRAERPELPMLFVWKSPDDLDVCPALITVIARSLPEAHQVAVGLVDAEKSLFEEPGTLLKKVLLTTPHWQEFDYPGGHLVWL